MNTLGQKIEEVFRLQAVLQILSKFNLDLWPKSSFLVRRMDHMSLLVARKPVSGVSEYVISKQAYSATETG